MPGERQGLRALAAGDREDPHAPGSASASTASGAGPRPGPARGLTLLNSDRSGDPVTRAAGIGCVRGFAGPREAGSRSGITRWMRPRRTTIGGAVKAQQSSATFKDQLRRVKARFRGAMRRRKKGAFEKPILLPLNRRRRFTRDVVHHTVNPAHFINNPRGNFCQQGIGQWCPICSRQV